MKHKLENLFDHYSIAVLKWHHDGGVPREKIVGHLPKEVSRLVKFTILHGAQASVEVIDETY